MAVDSASNNPTNASGKSSKPFGIMLFFLVALVGAVIYLLRRLFASEKEIKRSCYAINQLRTEVDVLKKQCQTPQPPPPTLPQEYQQPPFHHQYQPQPHKREDVWGFQDQSYQQQPHAQLQQQNHPVYPTPPSLADSMPPLQQRQQQLPPTTHFSDLYNNQTQLPTPPPIQPPDSSRGTSPLVESSPQVSSQQRDAPLPKSTSPAAMASPKRPVPSSPCLLDEFEDPSDDEEDYVQFELMPDGYEVDANDDGAAEQGEDKGVISPTAYAASIPLQETPQTPQTLQTPRV